MSSGLSRWFFNTSSKCSPFYPVLRIKAIHFGELSAERFSALILNSRFAEMTNGEEGPPEQIWFFLKIKVRDGDIAQ